MSIWQDPLDFTKSWAETVPLILPVPAEEDYARKALTRLADLLYDNPSWVDTSKRIKNQFVRRALKKLCAMITKVGFIETIKELKSVGHAILTCLKRGQSGVATFSIPEVVVNSPIFWAVLHFDKTMKESGFDSKLFRWIISWHYFLSKIPLDRPDLELSSETTWIERQEVVRTRNDIYCSMYTDELRRIVHWLFEMDTSVIPFVGNHGPGSTATGDKTVPEKNSRYVPSIQTEQLYKLHPIQDVRAKTTSRPLSSKLEFVKKDAGSLRPITLESIAMQYGQQGWKDRWYQTIDNPDSILPISRFVKFGDQKRAQTRAVMGSQGELKPWTPATIDLSAATDWLNCLTVTNLFQGDILHYIMCGRSWDSKTSMGTIELGMFAGMGSALTFPVQTTVFCAFAVLATIVALHEAEMGIAPIDLSEVLSDYLDLNGFKKPYRAYANAIQIYGDDISVPEIAVSWLFKLLEHHGLVVNKDKSFFGESFVRESCGIFSAVGADITPLRYRIPVMKTGELVDYAAFEGTRSLVNRSFHYEYKTLYRGVIRQFREESLFVSSKTNHKKRWNHGDYGWQAFGKPDILWEEYRGEDDYIGWISFKPSCPDHIIEMWEKLQACTSYIPSVTSDTDRNSDYYHLNRAYMLATEYDIQQESHGKIKRGIRLTISDAIPYKKFLHGESFMAWRWASKLRSPFKR